MKEGGTITFKGIKLTAVLSNGCSSVDGCGLPTDIKCHFINLSAIECKTHCVEEFVLLDEDSLAKHLTHKLLGGRPMSSFRAHAGQTFLHRGQELYVADCVNKSCSNGKSTCAMVSESGCTVKSNSDVPFCSGVIFVTRQQYLEMKLLGETR